MKKQYIYIIGGSVSLILIGGGFLIKKYWYNNIDGSNKHDDYNGTLNSSSGDIGSGGRCD